MRYLIKVAEAEDHEALYEGLVTESDAFYLGQHIEPTLQPLSIDEYKKGIAIILHTFARFSYILSGELLYWCTEWDPGLIVVRFSPDGKMAWSAIRSPVPDFGGRTPLQTDLDAYDDDAENHLYNLVFRAWDAQFDEQYRSWRGFSPASNDTILAYANALKFANLLGEELEKEYSDSFEQWAKDCKNNIELWAGDGMALGRAT